MLKNYHTHTTRCHHAKGTEKEYVEAAIKSGLKVLGFADHTPYPFPEGYSNHIRMSMNELEDYVTTVLNLKKEYEKDIEIHLGLEVEYFPQFFSELITFVSDYPIEYFLLAQHYLENSKDRRPYCGNATDNPQYLTRYCEQLMEAIDTHRFTYLAHPDLIHFTGDTALYEIQMRRLCRYAKIMQMPLEINFLGLAEDRHYPRETFWKIAGEESCDVVFGLDAHKPEAFLFEDTLKKAQAMVERYHLHLLDDVTFRRPF